MITGASKHQVTVLPFFKVGEGRRVFYGHTHDPVAATKRQTNRALPAPCSATMTPTAAPMVIQGVAQHYVVSFDWEDLPKTKVSWIMGIEDEFGGDDYAPNDFGQAVELDKVAPNTSITSGTSGKVDGRTAKFYFKSNEAGSTFRCRLDWGSWQSCSSPKYYSKLANGKHTFRVRATDKAGNADPTPAARSFTTAKRIKVTLKAKYHRSKLLVDVNPNKKYKNYRIKVQKKKSGKWRTVKKTRTKGSRDRRIINMPRGRYRIRVPAQFDMLRGTSNSVWLKR